ncbi:hypothetical protein [Pseudalkalibacillus hwajinpoensis]|uniref:Uncharacterized protein n=1 Tax=Guptibacillus hwajinpoensis TaxID=208199 RepID=A0A4U1MJ27_9BACL|nr:hypothetical protein [Pseudalkalibacillus hwajinpoensis]TKD71063.1 hypothetical protein FBF83_10745 [Pseudalkalibacillus hwajinpoensis]
MDGKKIHPLILLNLLFNGIAMGILAHDMYSESKIGYSMTFIVLGILFLLFLTYGVVRNQRIIEANSSNR